MYKRQGERLYNGIIKENPTFVLMLGMCPTLAVTTSAMNGLGMGLRCVSETDYQVYLNDEIDFIDDEPMLDYSLRRKEK